MNSRHRWEFGVSTAALLASLLGCSDDAASELGSNGAVSVTTGGNAATSGVGGTGATGTSTGGSVEPPPEQELEGSFRAPVATGRYLWTANPESSRVAIIDTEVLDIRIADAGFGPTYLAGVPSSEAEASSAIVINVLSQDATLFEIDAAGALTQQTFPLHAGANRWAVSPKGRWATAWTDAAEVENPDPTDGFQDISVIDLQNESVARLSVGYRPSQVVYDDDEKRLFVVTEPGISVIDLAGEEPRSADLIELEAGTVGGSAARDVNIAPGADAALVRFQGEPSISVVPLGKGERLELPMSGPVTDLDLSEDGSRALAVVRSQSDAVVIDVAALGDDGALTSLHVPGGVFGSVALSPQADVAVLFTNAIESDEATIVDLQAGDDFLSYRTVNLKSPVQAMFVAPDGAHAIALLSVPEGSSKAGAFSVIVTKAERAPKIVGTDAPPVAVALSPDQPSPYALITTRDDMTGIFEAHLIDLRSLEDDLFRLASPPLATGIIAERALGYVAQAHPEGRITFIDLARAESRTLTGFELATKVVD